MSGSRREPLPLDVLPVILPALGVCPTVVVCFFYDVGFLLNHQTIVSLIAQSHDSNGLISLANVMNASLFLFGLRS